jgi:ATP synthase protein I
MAIERLPRADRRDDEDEGTEPPFKALSREEAQALRERQPSFSPWRVVAVQALVGGVVALMAGWGTGRLDVFWSALYGAAVVVIPGALMARGITRPLPRGSVGAGVANFFVWEAVKVGLSVAMLALAPWIVQPLSWPALLVGLVLCLKCYWIALHWRGSKKN